MKKDKRSNRKKDSSLAYRIIYFLLSKIVGFILRIKVIGAENEPTEGAFIVCANHTSATDPIVICYSFKKHQVRFMAKKELFKIPFLSQLIRMLGAFPVDRSGSDVGAIKNAVALVNDGKSMGIFPQGHRYPGEDPRNTSTKNGAALICTKTGADIVPAYIMRKNNTPKFFRKTYVIIGEKIPFESLGYDPEATGEYARITNIIFDKVCCLGESFSPPQKNKKAKNKKGDIN